jgi:uncharacterized delta-60 repeat protein
MGAGAGRRNFMLARYTPDGALDGTFGSGGIVITRVAPGDNRDQVQTDGLTIDSAGRIIVGGVANMGSGAGGFEFAVARYRPNGTLDPSFDADGVVTTSLAPGDEFDAVVSVAIDPTGRILAAGVADQDGVVVDWALARYHDDGSLDSSFGSGGKVITNLAPAKSDDDLEAVVIQSTGKILVGGSAAPTVVTVDSDFAVGRYNPDGTLDRSFGDGGIVLKNTASGNGSDEIYGIALSGGPKLVVSGECDQALTGRDVCLARFKVGEDD